MIIKGNSLVEFATEEHCFISEVFNKPEFAELSLAIARVPIGVTTALHTLKNTAEIYYILEGKGEMYMQNEQMAIVNQGDAVFIAPNLSQKIKNIGDSDLKIICVCQPAFKSENYISGET